MDIQIRAFFVTFTSKCIQSSTCCKIDDALSKARSIVQSQEDDLESFFKHFITKWEVNKDGITMTTKPILHELFIDKTGEIDCVYAGKFPKNAREEKYDAGKATIKINGESLRPTIKFSNNEFVHGHLYHDDSGEISCWGAYGDIKSAVNASGPVAALTSMYAFAKMSRYGTHLKSEIEEKQNA